jgi:transposase
LLCFAPWAFDRPKHWEDGMAKKGNKRCEQLPVLHPDAAGIDVGASELFVAVAADRDPQSVRRFPTFTRDLNALADWLESCGVRSVAMESTSVYWIPVYQILETRGFEVYLVNAQRVKNVPGRKTDVSDCQWIQYLHSVGLLRGSFRPPAVICAIRSLWRHRSSLIQMAAEHVLHMQKALDQMNLQIHRVLNDITGLSGLRIIDAILAGEGIRSRSQDSVIPASKAVRIQWRSRLRATTAQSIYSH